MENKMDVLGLNNHKIMEIVRETLPKDIKYTKNVITIQDDILFMWNHRDCCVVTLNLTLLHDQSLDQVHYQTLLPVQPIPFDVTLVRVNTIVSLISLSGPNGVAVLELPRRSGAYGAFSNGKDVIYCRNYFLDERLFGCSKFIECQQVKWHPASPNDNHLAVLTSENMIRLYCIKKDGPVAERVWIIGKKPEGTMGPSRMPMLVALGETGVDFDFALPELSKDGKTLVWPVYVLRGNGDMYMLMTKMDKNGSFENSKLYGPLGMYPPADDNYGVDACAIICLQSVPTVIAISTCTGTIYHCVTLSPEEKIDVTDWTADESCTPDKSLFVFESIELETGLTLNDVNLGHTCPIYFHRVDISKSVYFCTHDSGVHAITVPFINQLERYINSKDENCEVALPRMNEMSTVEYIVCTHATSTSEDNPILGVAMLHNPGTLLALLGTGQMLSLSLSSVLLPALEIPHDDSLLDNGDVISPTKKILKQPFNEYIRNFLKPNLSQPILKTVGKVSDPKENYELLNRAIQTFREEHFHRLERVREEIEKRVKALHMLKEYQQKELDRLTDDKIETQSHTRKLAERYEDIKDTQEMLTKRSQHLLSTIYQKKPTQTRAEKDLEKELKVDVEKVKTLNKMLEQIRNKKSYQLQRINDWQEQQKSNSKYLGKMQTTTIKSALEITTKQINEMKNEIVTCKEQLGLS